MRAFAPLDITSPLDQVTTIPFLLESDAVEYYHSFTKQVQDDWFELMRVLSASIAYPIVIGPAWATRTGLQEPCCDRAFAFAFARRRRKCQSGIRTEKEREKLCVTLFCGCLSIINSVLGILLVVVDMLHGGVPKSPNCPRS